MWVSSSRIVGAWSGAAPSSPFTPANSGRCLAIGSSGAHSPRSCSTIIAAAVTGLVMEKIGKMVSRATGAAGSRVFSPCAELWTSLPCRATSTTPPASCRAAICPRRMDASRERPSSTWLVRKPTASVPTQSTLRPVENCPGGRRTTSTMAQTMAPRFRCSRAAAT